MTVEETNEETETEESYDSEEMSSETLALLDGLKGEAASAEEQPPEAKATGEEAPAEASKEPVVAADPEGKEPAVAKEPTETLADAHAKFTEMVKENEAKRLEQESAKEVRRSESRLQSLKAKFQTDRRGALREFLAEVAGEDKISSEEEQYYRDLTSQYLGTEAIPGTQGQSEAAALRKQLEEKNQRLAEIEQRQKEEHQAAFEQASRQAALSQLAPVLKAQEEAYPALFKGIEAYHALGQYLDDTPASVVLDLAQQHGISFEEAAKHVNKELAPMLERLTTLSASSAEPTSTAPQGSQGDTRKSSPSSKTLTNQHATEVPDGRSSYDYIEDNEESMERSLSLIPQ